MTYSMSADKCTLSNLIVYSLYFSVILELTVLLSLIWNALTWWTLNHQAYLPISHLESLPYLSHSGIISLVTVQLLLKHLGQNCTVFVLPEPKHTYSTIQKQINILNMLMIHLLITVSLRTSVWVEQQGEKTAFKLYKLLSAWTNCYKQLSRNTQWYKISYQQRGYREGSSVLPCGTVMTEISP